MSLDGCEARYKTPVMEERTSPQCGELVEVFTKRGKIIEDTPCTCVYVFKMEEQVLPKIPAEKQK